MKLAERRNLIMTHIKCTAKTCAFNCETSCALGDIHVGGDDACSCCETCCDSFTPSNASMGIAKNSCDKTMIECDVETCAHNSDGECCAENISISGKHPKNNCDTQCDTFVER